MFESFQLSGRMETVKERLEDYSVNGFTEVKSTLNIILPSTRGRLFTSVKSYVTGFELSTIMAKLIFSKPNTIAELQT